MLDKNARLTTVEAAALAKVDPTLIRRWASRHLLTPVARTRRGWPLYRAGDVLEVERQTRTGLLASLVDQVSH